MSQIFAHFYVTVIVNYSPERASACPVELGLGTPPGHGTRHHHRAHSDPALERALTATTLRASSREGMRESMNIWYSKPTRSLDSLFGQESQTWNKRQSKVKNVRANQKSSELEPIKMFPSNVGRSHASIIVSTCERICLTR